MPRRLNAFSLKELLVTIFIMGVLITLLVPSIEKTKKQRWIAHSIEKGEMDRVRKAVAERTIRRRDYPKFLAVAARHGQFEICRYFVEELKTPIKADTEFVFPAMMSGDTEILQYFLDRGAVIDSKAKNDKKQTLLHAACIGGNVDFCKTLLEKKASLEDVDFEGMTPIWRAAEHGHDEVFQLLADAGAIVDTKKLLPNGAYFLHVAAKGGSGSICRYLIEHGAAVNQPAPTHYSRLPIHYAAMAPRADATRVLIEAGADLNARDTQRDGFYPVMYAASPENIESLTLLILAGAHHNVHKEYIYGTLMQIAVEGGSLELCRFLREELASLDVRKRPYNDSLLHVAAKQGHTDICRWLLENGLNIDPRNDQGETPLILAAQRNKVETCRFLLESGADINAVGVRGTALRVAKNDTSRWPDGKDNAELLELLRSFKSQKPREDSGVEDSENQKDDIRIQMP